MPNWTDDEGNNWQGKIKCKRCLQVFKYDKDGEVPLHVCHGGWYKSESKYPEWHEPIFVKPFKE